MMLALLPKLVDQTRFADAHGPAIDIPASLLSSLRRTRPFTDVTKTGASGEAKSSTAAKGEAIFAICARKVAERLRLGQPWN